MIIRCTLRYCHEEDKEEIPEELVLALKKVCLAHTHESTNSVLLSACTQQYTRVGFFQLVNQWYKGMVSYRPDDEVS